MWRQGQVPQDFKDATIVHLYKRERLVQKSMRPTGSPPLRPSGWIASHNHRGQHRHGPSPPNVTTLSTHIQRAKRPGRTFSNSMQQQFTTSTSATPASDPTTTTPNTAAHDHRHYPPSSTPCADHGDEHHLPHSHHLSSRL
ncbi:unnamed protein product [Schistocephalus solidus]|uniref:Uncharacterized protein n=1 Tax=Schistocephalus solidus TaxID=70667 RepID=A0A183TNZ4_SCHSO|nr:unnamed protein product [Schistocephalus solidus]